MTGGTKFWSQIIFLKQIACWNTVRPKDAHLFGEAKKNHIPNFGTWVKTRAFLGISTAGT